MEQKAEYYMENRPIIKSIEYSESFQENCIHNKRTMSTNTLLSNQITTYTENDIDYFPKQYNNDPIRSSYIPNFFRTGAELRMSYIEKLIKQAEKNQELNPTICGSGYNSIILLDWDDTLLPSSHIEQCLGQGKEMTVQIKEHFSKMEFAVMRLLTLCISQGDVYIVTNATEGWVEYSSGVFYPFIADTLKKVKIISSRSLYEAQYPNDQAMWKIETFKAIRKKYKDIVTNVLCIGDSMLELDAAKKMSFEFKEAYCKCVKLQEMPRPDQLTKQLMLVANNFNKLNGMVNNSLIQIGNKVKS